MPEGWCDWKMYDDSHFALGVIAGNRQHICSSKSPTKISDFYAIEILDLYYNTNAAPALKLHTTAYLRNTTTIVRTKQIKLLSAFHGKDNVIRHTLSTTITTKLQASSIT